MQTSASPPPHDDARRLVGMSFRPGELPRAAADERALPLPAGEAHGDARFGLWGWLALVSGIVVLLAIVGGSFLSFAAEAVRTGNPLDLLLLAGLSVLGTSLAVVAAAQTRALRRLKSAERARESALQLCRFDGAGSGMRLLGLLKAVYADNGAVLAKLDATGEALQPHHSDRDVVDLLNREVFAPMDREADARIQRAALRASLGVSACPHPALDALVVLGMSFVLIRDLMRIYGLRPSTRSLYRVMTKVLFTASATAAMSKLVEFAANAAQDRIAAAIVGTAGEALVVARRMFTLGTLAKQEIRPLPLLSHMPPEPPPAATTVP